MPDFSFCPQCNIKYRTAGMPAFKRLRCKKCQGIFVVPEDSAEQSLAAAPEKKPDAAQPDKDAEHAIPAAIGDSSVLGRANFKGGVTLDGSPLPAVDDGSASQDTMEGLPRPVERKIEAAIKPSATDEKYIVEGEIARGGMGVILKAADRDIRRPVAMKVMLDAKSPKDKARFVEEAQVTGQLEHPNIVPIHELGIDAEGRLFFTMKLVKGKSLGDVLKALKKNDPKAEQDYPLGRLLNAFINICNAMAFAHAKGVVHRDLKPANIMLGDYGEVLVMDWGLAKVVAHFAKLRNEPGDKAVKPEHNLAKCATDQPPIASSQQSVAGSGTDSRDEQLRRVVSSVRDEAGGQLTMDGTIIGTPHYMPPEQADGKIEEIDARSDIYSLGAMLYEILTLTTPCDGKGIFALIKNVSEGNITPPDQRAPKRNIPKELSAITMKALARRKEDRYQRVEDLRRDIELFIEGRAVSAKEDTFAESVVKLVKRNKTASVVGGLAAAVLLVVLSGSAWINYQARQRAERGEMQAQENLAAFTAEQARRRDIQKGSAPAFVAAAGDAIERRNWDSALLNADAAIAYDPDLADAHFVRGEALIAKKDYKSARAALADALGCKPGGQDARELQTACEKALRGDEQQSSAAFGAVFMRRKEFTLAESHLRTFEGLVKEYNQRLKKAWPKCDRSIEIGKDGKLSLDLGNTGTKDLIPLKGIPLSRLSIHQNPITDLTPLSGMPLEELDAHECPSLTDLTPLKGMPLRTLNLFRTRRISNLDALKGMPIASLQLEDTAVRDLTPLTGMPLKALWMYGTKVTDLAPLARAPLEELYTGNPGITDIGPLKGMALRNLCLLCPVKDLTPLDGMRIEALSFPTCAYKGIEIIRSMKSMKRIALDIQPSASPEQFWKAYDEQGTYWQALVQYHWPGGEFGLLPTGGGKFCLWGRGFERVTDLAPLKNMPLSVLDVHQARITSLEPLRGMQLTELNLQGCQGVLDLAPLSGMPLVSVNLDGTKVADLTPLKGMRLTTLNLQRCGNVVDLSPLEGMPLTTLSLLGCAKIHDLAPLKSMALTSLDVGGCTLVQDLTPLKGMPLTCLDLGWCGQIKDLSPLRGMPLTRLALGQCNRIRELTPLKGMPLAWLDLSKNGQISDLTPLRGMPLAWLDLSNNGQISDLTPLRGMPLTELYLGNTGVTDLTPLDGMELGRLQFQPKNIRQGIEVIRNIKSLGQIDTVGKVWPPAEFWKKYDAGEFK
ncbi:MAG: protein kinase [Planctomycetota bacterium]|nr:protein kinase [Planctomycetota bacterium]